jgi:L-asparaginase
MIPIFSAGGTFEKEYGTGCGVTDFSFPERSAVAEMVQRLGIRDVEVIYDKRNARDSLDMTAEQRTLIARWCLHGEHDACIVVHGTDTMVDTARVIAEYNREKVVVLTGALQPARMRDSDAEFNLGSAIAAARLCSPGVYIAMGGNVFNWNKCRKHPTTGRFELL